LLLLLQMLLLLLLLLCLITSYGPNQCHRIFFSSAFSMST
jgi:hypothetical protein